jgi:molybdopterin converting factor small subunit
MAISITIPTPLRSYAGGQKTISVDGATVGEALGSLTTQYPNLRQHLFADDGQLRSFVNVYLNDEDVRYLKYVSTPVSEADRISIVPSVAGGCQRMGANQRMSTNELESTNGE